VALRADLDALPLTEASGLPFASTVDGVAHACGHDLHTTILLATGLALASADHLPGRVRLIFQPAEEVMPGGALDVIRAGHLEGVERIFGLHCDPRVEVGKVGTRVGALTSAADLVELRLTSPGGHTSRPHLTADLVHALGTVITSLPSLLSRRVDPRTGTVPGCGAAHGRRTDVAAARIARRDVGGVAAGTPGCRLRAELPARRPARGERVRQHPPVAGRRGGGARRRGAGRHRAVLGWRGLRLVPAA